MKHYKAILVDGATCLGTFNATGQDVLANRFIKDGGLITEYLMADGSSSTGPFDNYQYWTLRAKNSEDATIGSSPITSMDTFSLKAGAGIVLDWEDDQITITGNATINQDNIAKTIYVNTNDLSAYGGTTEEQIALYVNDLNYNKEETFTEIWVEYAESDIPLTGNFFITEWDTRITTVESTSDTEIKLPFTPEGNYNCLVDWGDGTTDIITNGVQYETTHIYDEPGIYTVTIDGLYKGWKFNNGGDKLKIKKVLQWGDLHIRNNAGFWGCTNLTMATVTDVLNLTETPSLFSMFRECDFLNAINRVNEWDTSSITSFHAAFLGCRRFNQNLEGWDTSAVVDMAYTFYNADDYNQNLDGWDVSNVINMYRMFYSAAVFNGQVNTWDVGNVTNMNGIFAHGTFNQDIKAWRPVNLINAAEMFYNNRQFDQPIGSWGASMSKITTLYATFRGSNFNQSIDAWVTSSLTNMQGTFRDNIVYNQPMNSWDVSRVYTMRETFYNTTSFNQPLNNWQTTSLSRMDNTFSYARSFDQDISTWDVSNVTTMAFALRGMLAFNKPLNTWDVSKVSNFSYMFNGASSFNQPLDNWVLSTTLAKNFTNMFAGATAFNQNINSWAVVKADLLTGIFNSATVFNQPLDLWNVGSCRAFDYAFRASAFNQDISMWETGTVANMAYMFQNNNVFNQDISGWNTSKVINMAGMFSGASAFNIDISSWNISSVTTVSGMFSETIFNQDISSWNTANCMLFSGMFENALAFNYDISSWNMEKATALDYMFSGAIAFNQPLADWTLTSVQTLNNFMLGKDSFNYSTANYDGLLISWNGKVLPSGITAGFGIVQRTVASSAAFAELTSAPKNWVINDGGI